MNLSISRETLKKGFPLSSTPIQAFEDSGYFGSNHKQSSSKALNACSPIKEFSFKNFLTPRSLEQDSIISQISATENITKNEQSPDTGIHELTELDVYSLDELCKNNLSNGQALLEQCSQNYFKDFPDSDSTNCLISFDSIFKNDIKYELFPRFDSEDFSLSKKSEFNSLKRTKVDFIHELKQMNCESIVSNILSNLTAEELCRVSCVSQVWKEAVSQDKKALSKKEKYLKDRAVFLTGPSKENRLGMKHGPTREHKSAFSNLTNTCSSIEQISKTEKGETKFDSFIKEAKKGHTKLLKCPICGYASKLQDEKNCVCTHCDHKFCSICYAPIYKHHACYKSELPKTIIGSKQSKKNLRRL